MNKNSTFLRPNLLILALALLTATRSFSQATGDYRTAATGNWNAPATWQRYDGSVWQSNPVAPTFNDGVITVRNTHTVTITAAITADQIVVETGGTLTMNVNNANLTLNDGTGTDLTIDGTFNFGVIGVESQLLGTGTVAVNGTFNWAFGLLAASTTISPAGILNFLMIEQPRRLNTSLINNGTINWNTGTGSGGLYFNNGTFTNNGTINEYFQSDRGFFPESGTNAFINTGIFNKTTNFKFSNLGTNFNNSGTLQGSGSYSLDGTVTNTGIIAPGNSPGTLTITPSLVTSKNPTIAIEIQSGTQGTGYDHLIANNTINVTGTNLVVTELSASAPFQTYNIITTTAGTVVGTFASVSLPPGYSLSYTSGTNTVAVVKSPTLPLTWGSISAAKEGASSVKLSFSTLQEIDTKDFTIEHSFDGQNYVPVGSVAASGNTATVKNYTFTHTTPSITQSNYYRIKQNDLNGKSSYSKTIEFRFGQSSLNIAPVTLKENPFTNVIYFNVNKSGLTVRLTSLGGSQFALKNVTQGVEYLDASSYPAGIYILSVYDKNQLVQKLKVIKQ